MKDINEMLEEDLLSDETMAELIDANDDIERRRLEFALEDRAEQLGQKVKARFKKLYKDCQNVLKKNTVVPTTTDHVMRITNFSGDKYPPLKCGEWMADDTGIYKEHLLGNRIIRIEGCYHPIMPIAIMKNMETQREKVTLVYKRRGKWENIPVAKETIANATKIIKLADYGVAVTSENAKNLVKFLSDIENLNDDTIPVSKSSSKMGWHNDIFLPYDEGIIYDGELDFKDLTESIREHGDKNRWLACVKELRKSGKTEIKMAIASSFASVLVERVGALPFVVDFWSKSGGGKTVLLMLACSVWASPEEHRYIGNFDQTAVGLEVKADLLNSLPMMLDDTSNATKWTMEDFERLIYMLCNGKGKSRSNRDLGMQRERHWRNCTLMNGEKPISDYVKQGGAINRTVECLCSEKIFEDPRAVLDVICNNYGFAGKDFVELAKATGNDALTEIYESFSKQLFKADKTAKQIAAAAVILTADKLATDNIFCDNEYLTVDDVSEMLVAQSDMSDDVRCYQYLIDTIASNKTRFSPDEPVEQWGFIEVKDGSRYVEFYKKSLKSLCTKEGFSIKSFINWTKSEKLLLCDRNKNTKNKKINGMVIPMFFIRIVNLEEENPKWLSDIDKLEIPF